MVVICHGVKPHSHQAQWAHHQVNTHCPWCWISKQMDRYHGGPCHQNGPWSLASSRGMPAAIIDGLSPCRDWVISANPGGGVGGWLPVVAQPPGLEWLVQSSGLWQWYVALAIPWHRLPRRTYLNELDRFCCGYVVIEWVQPFWMVWFSPN